MFYSNKVLMERVIFLSSESTVTRAIQRIILSKYNLKIKCTKH